MSKRLPTNNSVAAEALKEGVQEVSLDLVKDRQKRRAVDFKDSTLLNMAGLTMSELYSRVKGELKESAEGF